MECPKCARTVTQLFKTPCCGRMCERCMPTYERGWQPPPRSWVPFAGVRDVQISYRETT
jgi:hypothetical protein